MRSRSHSAASVRVSSYRGLRRGALVLALALVYTIVGRVGLAIAPVHLFASLVWAPTGIALAVLLRGGIHYWPGIALGAFLVNTWTGAPVAVALGISAGNTLEAVVGALLIQKATGQDFTLDRLRDVLAFVILGAGLSTIISASVGVGSLFAAGLVPRADLVETWRVWWLGDLVGDLVVGSFLLAWSAPRRRLDARQRIEAAALGAVSIAASLLVFLHPPVAAPTGFVQASLLIPLLMWVAVRFEMRGATTAVFLASAIAVLGTASGLGPFVNESLSSSLLHQQGFIAIVAVAVLIVGAVTAERADVLRRLTEADRRKNEFLGVLSHELRNPLAPIRNSLHILVRAPNGTEAAVRATSVIQRQTQQLTRLVDDLLDVTRISHGVFQLHRAPVELTALVRQAVEDHEPLFSSRSIALDLRLEPGPQWIEADAARMTQLVGNLLHNASKFTRAGGHVTVSGAQEAGRAVLRVTDDGVGIPPDLLPHVFEAFTQADSGLDRTLGGLGLGLALAKAIVDMHGGEIGARSEGPGRGSEITVRLPLRDDLAAAAPEERLASASTTAARRRRILVIEDNVDAAESLKEGLEMSGHEVFVAHDGLEGIARARALSPDVVLCDIGLPGVDGYEVARRIRADPSLSPLLVAVTGYALPEDQLKARAAGFDQHLAKPFQFRDVEEVVASAVAAPAHAAAK